MIPSPFHGIFSSTVRSDNQLTPTVKDDAAPRQVTIPEKSSAPARRSGSTGVGQARQASVGQVALDIFEYDEYYILKAPIAGVRLSDLDIEVNDNVLTIRGNRRQADEIPDEQYYLKECFWGDFQRSVTLPCSIDPRKIKATFNKDCVLKILVPKEEKVKIIRISE